MIAGALPLGARRTLAMIARCQGSAAKGHQNGGSRREFRSGFHVCILSCVKRLTDMGK
jgi:hypothetical protein